MDDNSIWKWQMALDRYGGLDAPITFEIWNPSQGSKKSRPVAYYKTTMRALTFWERCPFMYLREISTKKEKKGQIAVQTSKIKSRTTLMEIKCFRPMDAMSPRTPQKSPIKAQQEYTRLRDRAGSAIPDLSSSKVEKEVPIKALNRSNSAIDLSPGSKKQSQSKLNPKPMKIKVRTRDSDSEEETSTLQNSVYLPEETVDDGTEKSIRSSF